jgi:hypothetical protein
MFEKIGRLAETAANKVSVSRRGFLGQLGQGALAMTGVLGGLLAIPRDTRAAGSYVCCKWKCRSILGGWRFYRFCGPAPYNCNFAGGPCAYGGTLNQSHVSSCNKCT